MSDRSDHRLQRSVKLGSAIMLGLGSILGTGVYVSLGLAVDLAASGAIVALFIAALLALCNALSSAQLAANHPVSGGTYAYANRYLNPYLGFVAGIAFLMAKSASAAAAALGVVYAGLALSGLEQIPVNLAASGIVLLVTGLVAGGLSRANLVNTILVCLTVIILGILIASAFVDSVDAGLRPPESPLYDWHIAELLKAAALIFVAFTGYGRIATLGEEVVNPRRTIPLAIIVTLLITFLLYLGILISGLSVLGASGFGTATQSMAAPLQAIASQLNMPGLVWAVGLASILAMLGVLLNLLLGLSRMSFAMGREGDLPVLLGHLNLKKEPVYAVWAVGSFIALLAFFGGLGHVWSFSAFTVLIYYSLTNLSALQLNDRQRLYPKVISLCGLIGCLGLSVWIGPAYILSGLLILGLAVCLRFGLTFIRMHKDKY